MSNLFIIGNGFDIYHGCKSSYKDFLEYMCMFHHDKFHSIGSLWDNGNPSYLWMDFENHLVDFNFVKHANIEFPKSITYAKDYPNRCLDKYTYIENQCDELHEELSLLFRQWVQDTLIGRTYDQRITLSPIDHYISFNYTNLLEDTYKIPTSHICYLHKNLLESQYTRLIFGHGSSSDTIDVKVSDFVKKNELFFKRINVNKEDVYNIYYKLLLDLKKDPQEIINGDDVSLFFKDLSSLRVKNIYCLGHSFGLADEYYFQYIFKNVHCEKIICSYYSKEDQDRIEQFFQKNTISNPHELKLIEEINL